MVGSLAAFAAAVLWSSKAEFSLGHEILGSKELQLVQQLSARFKLGDNALDIPKIVVIGDQSSGKTTIFNAMLAAVASDARMPTGDGMQTRMPILLALNSGAHHQVLLGSRDITSNVRQEISSAQDKACSTEDSSGATPSVEQPAVDHSDGEDSSGATPSTKAVSNQPLQLTVMSPNVKCAIVLVDLPGLARNAEDATEQAIRSMVESYIDSPRSVIVVVTPARDDDGTQEALKLARKADPEGRRTLRVYSKCDIFDQRKRTVLEAITEAEFSPHALDLSEHDDKSVPDVVPTRTGIASLIQRLAPMLGRAVRSAVPALELEISKRLGEIEQKLDTVGREPPSADRWMSGLRSVLNDIGDDLGERMTPAQRKFESNITSSLDSVNEEAVDREFQYDVYTFPWFQGENAARKVIRNVGKTWQELSATFVEDTHSALVMSSLEPNLVEKVGHSSLAQAVEEEWNKILHQARKDAHSKIRTAVRDQLSATAVGDSDALVRAWKLQNDATSEESEATSEESEATSEESEATSEESEATSEESEATSEESDNRRLGSEDALTVLESKQKEYVLKAVKVWSSASSRSIIHNAMIQIRVTFREYLNNFIKTSVMNENLRNAASKESPEVTERRSDLLKQRDDMLLSQEDIKSIRFKGSTTSSTSGLQSRL